MRKLALASLSVPVFAVLIVRIITLYASRQLEVYDCWKKNKLLFWLALHTLISSRLEYAKETRQQIRDLLMKSHSQFITMSNTVSQVKSLPSQSRTELLADAKELEAQLNEEYRDLEYSTFSGYSAGRWNPKLPTSPSVCIDTPTIAGQPWSKVMRIGLDTKQEIRAIKGQLLNRRNFPSQT